MIINSIEIDYLSISDDDSMAISPEQSHIEMEVKNSVSASVMQTRAPPLPNPPEVENSPDPADKFPPLVEKTPPPIDKPAQPVEKVVPQVDSIVPQAEKSTSPAPELNRKPEMKTYSSTSLSEKRSNPQSAQLLIALKDETIERLRKTVEKLELVNKPLMNMVGRVADLEEQLKARTMAYDQLKLSSSAIEQLLTERNAKLEELMKEEKEHGQSDAIDKDDHDDVDTEQVPFSDFIIVSKNLTFSKMIAMRKENVDLAEKLEHVQKLMKSESKVYRQKLVRMRFTPKRDLVTYFFYNPERIIQWISITLSRIRSEGYDKNSSTESRRPRINCSPNSTESTVRKKI